MNITKYIGMDVEYFHRRDERRLSGCHIVLGQTKPLAEGSRAV